MGKILMRSGCISVNRRGALGSGLHLASLFRGQGRATDCLCLGGFFPGDNVPGNSKRRVAMSVPEQGQLRQAFLCDRTYPTSNISSSQKGRITAVADENQRIIQFGLKLLF